jgi:hypothetical protein
MISAFLVMTDHGAGLGILIADLIGHYRADRVSSGQSTLSYRCRPAVTRHNARE